MRPQVTIHPLQDGELAGLSLQPSQAHLETLLRDPAYRAEYCAQDLSFAVREDGRLAAAAGVMPLAAHRAFGWALIERLTPRGWVVFTGVTLGVLAKAQARGYRRLETIVDADFPPGITWVNALGFEVEGLMPGYWPDGRGALLYGRFA